MKMRPDDRRIFASFDGAPGGDGLSGLCLGLLSRQKSSWPGLAAGYASLGAVREREIPCGGYSVRLQFNPERIKSALSGLGGNAAAERPCFLCPGNLPPQQKGILYRGQYLILCNPVPILDRHLTISHAGHRPQAIEENLETFLRLAADLGPGWVVFYNGPRCGASAPDHLHFQAAPSGGMPVEKEMPHKEHFFPVAGDRDAALFRAKGIGREVLLLEGGALEGVQGFFERVVDSMRTVLGEPGEPMVNLVASFGEGAWRLMVFPRRKHRPDAFFAEGDGKVVVSPGAIDMAGLIVTPVERDFIRLDARAVAGIYGEVSLGGETAGRVVDALA